MLRLLVVSPVSASRDAGRVAAAHSCATAPENRTRKSPRIRLKPFFRTMVWHRKTRRNVSQFDGEQNTWSTRGSNEFASPRTLTCCVIRIVIARKSRHPQELSSAMSFVANSQDGSPSARKYRFFTYRALFMGCRRPAHFQSSCPMCESIDEKLAFATT